MPGFPGAFYARIIYQSDRQIRLTIYGVRPRLARRRLYLNKEQNLTRRRQPDTAKTAAGP